MNDCNKEFLKMKQQLTEGADFYYNADGYMVLTEKYHLDRGFCCGNGCLHCPFDYVEMFRNHAVSN